MVTSQATRQARQGVEGIQYTMQGYKARQERPQGKVKNYTRPQGQELGQEWTGESVWSGLRNF